MDFAKAKALAATEAASFVSQPKVKCPKAKTCLMVLVYKEDTGQVVQGARVQVSGTAQGATTKTFLSKNTDGNGLAKYTPWNPGSYDIETTVPQQDGYEPPEVTNQTVTAGTCPICCIPIRPLPKLKVKVVQNRNEYRVFADAVVEVVSGPQQHANRTTNVAGIADFGTTKSGKYVVKAISLKEADKKEFVIPRGQEERVLSSGDDETIVIRVEKKNVVTPKIEMEYKVVLLERGLSRYQKAGEEKILADPTYIQLSYSQTELSHPFEQGAKVRFVPANVDVYFDEQCKRRVPGDPATGLALTSEQISRFTGLQLYLRGKTAGKFKVTFELENPRSEFIQLDQNPAEEEMGVVELKLKVHQHDATDLNAVQIDPDTDPIATYHTNLKDKVLPAQKALTDEQKVKVGRFLHVDKDGNNGRAKLLVERLEASQWPAGTDDYEIFINRVNTSGSVEIYDLEWEGTLKRFPVGMKVSDLKAAEKQFWVQGREATRDWREVRLDLTLDRDEGGLRKDAKQNADWARFTVVQIKEVKVDYTATPGQPVAWDDNEHKFNINFKADSDGRKLTISAELSEKLAGATVHFMLAPDADNGKSALWGVDLPATWKWKDVAAAVKHKDKNDRKALLHLSAKTDAKGLAKKELVLSRFGGDKFWPGAYIDQDPHLAKYVRGHADLEKKKPVLAKDPITVWRKFWYQPVKVEGLNPPGLGASAAKYLLVKSTMEACADLAVTRATVNLMNPRAIYPRYMIEVNGGGADALVVSETNKAQFFAGFVKDADKPIEVPALVCDAQWDPGGNSGSKDFSGSAASFPVNITMDKLALDPPLQGGTLFAGGSWVAAEDNHAGGWDNVRTDLLTAADVSISATRGGLYDVTVALPAGVGATTVDTRVWINGLVIQGADGPFLGEYDKSTQRILAVYDPADPGLFAYAVSHELGHAFFQVTEAPPAGVPAHPHQYLNRGSHCSHLTDKCLMYHTAPIVGSLERFCDVCHPYMLVQDMWKLSS